MPNPRPSQRCTAFSGVDRIASGELRHVALKAKQAYDLHPERPVLVFDDADARPLELPLELPPADLLAWLSRPTLDAGDATGPARPRRPGRPRLGVVAREVTLLPRHWEWLAAQPGGASAALRRLVEQARRADDGAGDLRQRREAQYQAMRVLAGDLPGFEEASRALFAGDTAALAMHFRQWPADVGNYLASLSVHDAG